MSELIDQLHQTLKSAGFSLTTPRKAVFAALQNQEPLTMNQLAIHCPQIDRASVYRTIKLFEKLGVVQRLNIGWKYKIELSNDYQQHHHHLTCIKCGKIIPFEEDDSLVSQLQEISKVNHFKMQGHQLEIQGLCSNCLQS